MSASGSDDKVRRIARRGGPKWDKELTRELFRRYKEEGDEEARQQLVTNHLNLVRHVAAKYAHSSVPMEDLVQVGTIGLINAIDRFDPSRGFEFTTYAMPTIKGEIRRYFRDKSWSMNIPRSAKELSVKVRQITEELTAELLRTPTVSEIAERANVPIEDIIQVMEYKEANNLIPLEGGGNDDDDSSSVIDWYRTDDFASYSANERIMLVDAIKKLSKNERYAFVQHKVYERKQSDIAKELGVSQVQVSRLVNRAIKRLREYMRVQDDEHL